MQLLKITTTAIEYRMHTENASLRVIENKPARLDPTQEPGKLEMRSQDIKVQLDTTRARDSMGLRNPAVVIREQGRAGMQAAQEATAQYAAIGNQLAQIHTGQDIPSVFAQMMNQQSETAMVFIPSQGPDISWKKGDLSINYEPTPPGAEYKAAKFTMEYVPAKYKMDIVTYPKVSIEYIGGPIYVPPSANPNYEDG